MAKVSLAEVADFLDGYLRVPEIADYAGAMNGLQVDGPGPVQVVAAAVDASETAIAQAAAGGADLLVVHHGLFWDGPRPITGHRYRKVRALVQGRLALYGAHLPLDAHEEVGNAAVLAAKLGLQDARPFGDFKGTSVGRAGSVDGVSETEFARRLEAATGEPVRVLPGGPRSLSTVAVATGAGASLLADVARDGLCALVTGEAQHHHAIEAAERGVTVFLGGHYATETWGVKALAEVLEDRLGVRTFFIDLPTGL